MIFERNKQHLLNHFQKEQVLFAYHIGDLDDFYFPDCLWGAIYSERKAIQDTLLLYTGLVTPSLLAFGLTDQFIELLNSFYPILPKQFFCHYQEKDKKWFDTHFNSKDLGRHIKMKLTVLNHDSIDMNIDNITRLNITHQDQLLNLYKQAYPDNYFIPRMLETEKYVGYFIDKKLVGVAGVHVDSDEFRIAVLGNITTHPDFRGKSIAKQLTAYLTNELNSENKTVCLNVKDDNVHAIKCYKSIGFKKMHEYREAFFSKRK